ncbi:SIR2 family protein [Bradyrhizobium sp. 147]|uniref:SIR2 family protein n=1 Tax=Bradyrhizobium sp. 147 TaxID=2782623 RepID=UPI001FF98385|nr:SIR2 family protein [Bradyrhizobium sp. 147]
MQSIARSGIHVDCWYPIYDPASQKVDHASATHWPTVLRKAHGSVLPVKSFLITDADYVEVLTAIGIQTPVPNLIKERRNGRSFLFFGCLFNDRLFAIYARQITKRSADVHYAWSIRKHSRATNSTF